MAKLEHAASGWQPTLRWICRQKDFARKDAVTHRDSDGAAMASVSSPSYSLARPPLGARKGAKAETLPAGAAAIAANCSGVSCCGTRGEALANAAASCLATIALEPHRLLQVFLHVPDDLGLDRNARLRLHPLCELRCDGRRQRGRETSRPLGRAVQS